MILYDNGDWFEVIFTYVGTVWPQIRTRFIVVTAYAVVAYAFQAIYRLNFGTEGKTILMGTMSFLLIFRANQAYARYWQGRSIVSELFSDIREFIMLTLIYTRGGINTATFLFHGGPGIPPKSRFIEDGFDQKAHEMRVDVVRLCVALGVAFKLHTRIAHDGYCFGSISRQAKWYCDFDRLRLRQLLTEEEFKVIDGCVGIHSDHQPGAGDPLEHLFEQFGLESEEGPQGPPPDWPEEFEVETACRVRQPVAIIFLLRVVLCRNMNDASNSQPWGVKDRFVGGLASILTTMQYSFELANQIVTTPLPLPYANICKTLLGLFLLSLPFFVDYELGWFANTVIPAITCLALLGIDAIATELENPFGDDDNDLDILEQIHCLESEAMEMLRLSGDEQGRARFLWQSLPDFVKACSCRTLRKQLVLRESALPASLGS
mmetsp:Transcript_19487/g.61122  ORF Transcript_19487/g.61122 Transcript_19487/m.61122 type:complete len:433 (+) Transcript_19487:66-1364(+)